MYFLYIILLIFIKNISTVIVQENIPYNLSRNIVDYQWCECGEGTKYIQFWFSNTTIVNYTLISNHILWFKFQNQISTMFFICNPINNNITIKTKQINIKTYQWLSISLYSQMLQQIFYNSCDKIRGLVSFIIYEEVNYLTNFLFISKILNYACFIKPTLLKTNLNTLIVFAQAKKQSCDQFAATDIVYKRSQDQGQTWSEYTLLLDHQTIQEICGNGPIMAGISPLQLSSTSQYHPNRILLPYTQNYLRIWLIYSDDDGITWENNHQLKDIDETSYRPDCNRNMTYFSLNVDTFLFYNIPDYIKLIQNICQLNSPFQQQNFSSKLAEPSQYINLGPEKSIQLQNGRIIVSGYRSPIRGLSTISQFYNNFGVGFVIYSDDDGDTWQLSKKWQNGVGFNQNQMIQLQDQTIIGFSRSLSFTSKQFMAKVTSEDHGQTFSKPIFAQISQPFGGSQGSFLKAENDVIYMSLPNDYQEQGILSPLGNFFGCKAELTANKRLILWESINQQQFQALLIIDSGKVGYSSLQRLNNKILIAYQQIDNPPTTQLRKLQQFFIGELRRLASSRIVIIQIQLQSK